MTIKSFGVGLLALSVTIVMPANAISEKNDRVALVIGISRYPDAPLKNPVNDAKAMGTALRSMGFRVIEVDDARKEEILKAIESARNFLKESHTTALLYYAGHGFQVDYRNYIVPIDANLSVSTSPSLEAIDMDRIVSAFTSAGSETNIVILDACRDNPFPLQQSGKGLAPSEAPPHTFLAYATAPGNIASDGSGPHGLYTENLLPEIQREGSRIEDVFKRVRLKVRVQSDGRQIPWESTSLENDFYFIPSKTKDREHESDEKEMDRELRDWDLIKQSGTPADYVNYLVRYPSGFFSEAAQFRLDHLNRPSVIAQVRSILVDPADPLGARVLAPALPPPGVNRYHVGDSFEYLHRDGFTGLTDVLRETVTSANDFQVVFNTGNWVTDQSGNFFTNSGVQRTPQKIEIPAEFTPGNRWRSAFRFVRSGNLGPEPSQFRGGQASSYWDFRLVDQETVTVPAGTYFAFRIDGSTAGGASTTIWLDPASLTRVKWNYASKFSRDSYELTKSSRAVQ